MTKTQKQSTVKIGKKWTLECVKLLNGKIAGYVTNVPNAATYAINDAANPSQ